MAEIYHQPGQGDLDDTVQSTESAIHPDLIKVLNPAQTALLVVNVQKAYYDPNVGLPKLLESDTDELHATVPRINEFTEVAREHGVPIIYTRAIETPDCTQDNLRLKRELDGMPPISTLDDPGFEYFEVQPRKGDLEIVNEHYNPFTGTDLDQKLRDSGIITLVIAGGYSSRGVLFAGYVASDILGYYTFIASDLVGVPQKLKSEPEVTSNILDTMTAHIVTSEDILKAWTSHKSS